MVSVAGGYCIDNTFALFSGHSDIGHLTFVKLGLRNQTHHPYML